MDTKRKNGFTLSEVLITLSIIGVIAAITIPIFAEKYQQKSRIIAWRKAYSLAANALVLMHKDMAEVTDEKIAVDTFAKYLNAVKVCDINMSSSQGCRKSPDVIKTYDGKWKASEFGQLGGGCASIILINGITLCVDCAGESCPTYFDVNGEKGPNRIGYDIFAAYISFRNYIIMPANGYRNGFGPVNSQLTLRDLGNGTCQAADFGVGCSTYYLTHDD